MQDVSEIFRGSGFKIFARILETSAESGGVGDSGAGRRLARVLRPHEFLGARRGPAGARLYLFRARRRRRRSAAGRSPTISARKRPRRCARKLGLKDGDAVFFVAGEPASFVKFAGPARTKIGEELGLVAKGPLRALLDRRFPDVRMERGGEEDRLLPQSVLDAEHAGRGISGARSGRSRQDSRAQGDPIRHRLQRRRAVLRRDPQSSSRGDEKGLRHRRL